MIRGAVLAVPVGQIEAAKAIGMPRGCCSAASCSRRSRAIALPGLGNVWQFTIKDTALISVTGLVELMRQAHVAAGSTRQPFTFYLVAALALLLLTAFSNYGFQRAEGWANRA